MFTFEPGTSSIVTRLAPALALILFLAACGGDRGDSAWKTAAPKAADDPAAEAGYLRPPVLSSTTRLPDGRIALSGRAAPGVEVRLGVPGGQPLLVRADEQGNWTLVLPRSGEVRIFSLSMIVSGGRLVQSAGYLAILPDGRAVVLRPGAAALVLGEGSDKPRLQSIDFDEGGAATIAGSARPGSGLALRIDRAARAAGKTDDQGRFHLVVEGPIAAGGHLFEVSGDSGEQVVQVPVARAESLTSAFRAVQLGPHWRIDWMTPAGGLQSTLIVGAGS